jgi:hypothetical protein
MRLRRINLTREEFDQVRTIPKLPSRGLDPRVHVFGGGTKKDVDGRVKPGHGVMET